MQQENIKNLTNNLFLIGMMASWKSTVGRKLSETLKMDFIDTDDAIEEITEMKIVEIFREFGEKRFREMEEAFFIEKAKKTGQIFSTGGGIVLNKKNRKVLQNNGICFFLKAKPKILAGRINNSSKRPLLGGSEKLEDKLSAIWNIRKNFYKECANHTIITDHLKPNQVLDKILRILENTIADN